MIEINAAIFQTDCLIISNIIYNIIIIKSMILHILLFPFILTICYLIPLVSTNFAKNNNLKWLSFWLITFFASYTIIPFFAWILG
jgi:hypothetical protein